jgi:hypothetical protein
MIDETRKRIFFQKAPFTGTMTTGATTNYDIGSKEDFNKIKFLPGEADSEDVNLFSMNIVAQNNDDEDLDGGPNGRPEWRLLRDNRNYGYQLKENLNLRNMILGPPVGITKFHFFGDIMSFDIHWLKENDTANFLSRNFGQDNISKSRFSDDNEVALKNNGRTFRLYNCSNEFFNKTIYEEDFKERMEKYISAWGKDKNLGLLTGWENVKVPTGRKSHIPKGEYLNNNRIYCMGCVMGAPRTKMYLLTGINPENNELSYFITGKKFLSEIYNLYEKNKEGYETAEQWLYDYDFEINRISSAGDYKIVFEKTKYKGMEGSILSFHPYYVIRSRIVFDSIFYNNYSGEEYKNVLEGIYPISLINFSGDVLKFRTASSDHYYKEAKLKVGQIKSSLRGNNNFNARGKLIEI